MSRGKRQPVKKVIPDNKYGSTIVTRLINKVMWGGKKVIAENIVYSAISTLGNDDQEAINNFETALRNVIPAVEVRSRRIGGANYQVPTPVKASRGETLAIRWILEVARNKKGKAMSEKLGLELKDALSNTGEAVRKKELTYKMADANKAFSHFKW